MKTAIITVRWSKTEKDVKTVIVAINGNICEYRTFRPDSVFQLGEIVEKYFGYGHRIVVINNL